MDFNTKLDYLMGLHNIKNRKELSIKSGIPYTTIKHWNEKSADNILFGNIRLLSLFFGISIGYWADNSKQEEEALTNHEKQLVNRYRLISQDKKEAVEAVLGLEKNSSEDALSSKEA